MLTEQKNVNYVAILHLRKIGLLHLTLRCDVNLHSKHCMPGSLTKPALRTPQHQCDDTQHDDGLKEGLKACMMIWHDVDGQIDDDMNQRTD